MNLLKGSIFIRHDASITNIDFNERCVQLRRLREIFRGTVQWFRAPRAGSFRRGGALVRNSIDPVSLVLGYD